MLITRALKVLYLWHGIINNKLIITLSEFDLNCHIGKEYRLNVSFNTLNTNFASQFYMCNVRERSPMVFSYIALNKICYIYFKKKKIIFVFNRGYFKGCVGHTKKN